MVYEDGYIFWSRKMLEGEFSTCWHANENALMSQFMVDLHLFLFGDFMFY